MRRVVIGLLVAPLATELTEPHTRLAQLDLDVLFVRDQARPLLELFASSAPGSTYGEEIAGVRRWLSASG